MTANANAFIKTNSTMDFNKLLKHVLMLTLIYLVTLIITFFTCVIYSFGMEFSHTQRLLMSTLPIFATAYYVLYNLKSKND